MFNEQGLGARCCSKHFTLNPDDHPRGRYHTYLPLTGEETEAQRCSDVIKKLTYHFLRNGKS